MDIKTFIEQNLDENKRRQLIGEYNQHLGQVGYLRGMQRGLNQ
jgi:hypothetical protein